MGGPPSAGPCLQERPSKLPISAAPRCGSFASLPSTKAALKPAPGQPAFQKCDGVQALKEAVETCHEVCNLLQMPGDLLHIAGLCTHRNRLTHCGLLVCHLVSTLEGAHESRRRSISSIRSQRKMMTSQKSCSCSMLLLLNFVLWGLHMEKLPMLERCQSRCISAAYKCCGRDMACSCSSCCSPQTGGL